MAAFTGVEAVFLLGGVLGWVWLAGSGGVGVAGGVWRGLAI